MSILSTNPPPVRARPERPIAAWQAELRDAIRDPRELCAALGLPTELGQAGLPAAADFACLVPASYLARIEYGNPNDPLLRQVLPFAAEGDEAAGFSHDPVDEAAAVVTPGLLQKYPGRALLVVTSACPVHCRYCFRRHFPYDDGAGSDVPFETALAALRDDRSIEEVILSGGDPLSATDRRLAVLVDKLAGIPHLARLRVHTRMPVVIPSRVTDELVSWLAGSRLTPVMVLHANHARELDAAVASACDRLRRAGVMLLNQAVLLRGVNDSVDDLCALSRRLIEIGVTPYYLHQLDRVAGAADFEVPISHGRALIADMRRRLPGYAVPQYVQERPGELHKIVLQMVNLFDLPNVEQLRRELQIDPQALRRFRNALLKHGRSDAEALTELPEGLRGEFAERVALHALELHSRCDSSQDGATKLLFRTDAGMLIESVILRIATGRTTLCLSSQVGCAAACEFCATGKMGIARNLTPAEILDQFVQARQIAAAEGRSIRNLVFMGMGEPFHNEENLYTAIGALTAPELFHQPPSRILVSTVGLPEAMIRAARRFPEVHFALSLHSARQDVRERLIPLASRYPLMSLRRALVELNRIQPANTDVMIEYIMLAGLNDSTDDAQALAAWLAGLRVHVNLIPYNPVDDAPHLAGSDRAKREAFGALLKASGLKTTIRYSLGFDIAAACGQLVRRENRAHAARAASSLISLE